MKIVNEWNAERIARQLGILPQALERHYGMLIIKDTKMMKSTWMDSDDDELFYCVRDILRDHPDYTVYFSTAGIDGQSRIRSSLKVHQVIKAFSSRFDARPEFEDDCRQSGAVRYRLASSDDERFVAVHSDVGSDGYIRVDAASVVYGYGQYVRQRIIPSNNSLGMIANDLLAWVNAIWIAWLVGLDPRIVFIGAAIDSADCKTTLRKEIVFQVLTRMSDIACSRKAARDYFNACGPYDLDGKDSATGAADDYHLCLQIVDATQRFLEQILAG